MTPRIRPDTEPDVRDEHEQPREHADRDRAVEAGQRQRHRVVGGQHQHHQQLPAQELGEHAVDVAADRAHLREPVARHQRVDALADHVPVAQQVEHHDGNQHQVHENGDQDQAAALHAGQHLQRQAPRLVHVLGDERLERFEVERERDAELLLQPGRDPARRLRGEFGQPLRGEHHFRLHERDQHEEQRDQDEPEQQHDERRRQRRAERPFPPPTSRWASRGTRGSRRSGTA